jgi:hypothetical protein
MKQSAIYSKLVKTAALATLAVTALVATTAQARPHFIQDVQYVQGGAQLVITPPQLVIQAPLPQVYVAPVQPVYAQPVYTQPVYPRHVLVQPQPVYTTTYVPGRIYYINGHPYLNGHPYVYGHGKGHYKPKHFKRHHDHDDRWDRHDGRHDQGRHGGPRH